MYEKDLNLPLYYDCYSKFLTEKQASFFEMYYNEDLSLAEIAAVEGISRQGVRDALERARKKLYDMESKLGLAAQAMER